MFKPIRLHDIAAMDKQCCFVDEHGERCEAESRFWIGRTFLDYSYGCGDHVEDLRGDGHSVIRLSDGVVVDRPVERG